VVEVFSAGCSIRLLVASGRGTFILIGKRGGIVWVPVELGCTYFLTAKVDSAGVAL
jgi:hypothetical protein